MLSSKLRLAMLIAIGVYFLIVFLLLKKESLNLKYTLLWLLSGIIMLVLAVFPQTLIWFAVLVGIYDPTNALFSFMFFCVIILLMSLTAIVSKLNEKSKRLIQALALMEKRIRDMETMPGDDTTGKKIAKANVSHVILSENMEEGQHEI